jgi:hypothetical protein
MFLNGRTATDLYREICWNFHVRGREEGSRNGPVITLPGPTMVMLCDPTKRILFAPQRKPNPVFHLMEAIWMFAGENRVEWLLQFNKGMKRYAEPESSGNHIHGAYGHRWRHWGQSTNIDQLSTLINVLREDINTRQAVLSMWDPELDLGADVLDRPCNTQVMFRWDTSVGGGLDMTVINRSNDLFWGMMGSNIVHMTMLHEWVASTLGVPLGSYFVMTNNLHMYTELYPGATYGSEGRNIKDLYRDNWKHIPMPSHFEFLRNCENFVKYNGMPSFTHPWWEGVAKPMFDWWHDRTSENLNCIKDTAWRVACQLWQTKPWTEQLRKWSNQTTYENR